MNNIRIFANNYLCLFKHSFLHINLSIFELETYHISHEEFTSTIAHAQTSLHEGHNSVEGIHISPVHVILKKKQIGVDLTFNS